MKFSLYNLYRYISAPTHCANIFTVAQCLCRPASPTASLTRTAAEHAAATSPLMSVAVSPARVPPAHLFFGLCEGADAPVSAALAGLQKRCFRPVDV